MTDGRTYGWTERDDCNIPDAFLKKRGDNDLNVWVFPFDHCLNFTHFAREICS